MSADQSGQAAAPAPFDSDVDQYATIAPQYAHMRAEHVSYSLQVVEEYVLGELLGDLAGLRVLDLACGSGHYARRYASSGAARVLGVDFSEPMIEQARRSAAACSDTSPPNGQFDASRLEFAVADARTFRTAESFDLVSCLYLLNHARNEEELGQMLATAYAALRPGGRLVAINNRFEQHPDNYPPLEKYGYCKRLLGPAVDGTPVEVTLRTADGPITFEDYYCSQGTLERAIIHAGFTHLRWVLPYLPPHEKARADFWQDFLDDPSHHYFEAIKPQ